MIVNQLTFLMFEAKNSISKKYVNYLYQKIEFLFNQAASL